MRRVALLSLVSSTCPIAALEDVGSTSTFLAPESPVPDGRLSLQADWLGVEQPTQTQKGVDVAREAERSLTQSALDISRMRFSKDSNKTTTSKLQVTGYQNKTKSVFSERLSSGFLFPGQIVEAKLHEKGEWVKVVVIKVVFSQFYVQTVPGDWSEGLAYAIPNEDTRIREIATPPVDRVEILDFEHATCSGNPFYIWPITSKPGECLPVEQLLPRGVMRDPTQRTLILKDEKEPTKEVEYGFGKGDCKSLTESAAITLCTDDKCDKCTGKYDIGVDGQSKQCKAHESPIDVPIGIGAGQEESERFYKIKAGASRWTCIWENNPDPDAELGTYQNWPKDFWVSTPRSDMQNLPQETFEGQGQVWCSTSIPKYCAYPTFGSYGVNYFSPWHDLRISPTEADIKTDAGDADLEEDSKALFHWVCLMPMGTSAKMQVSKELKWNPITNVTNPTAPPAITGAYQHGGKGLPHNVGFIPQTYGDPMDGEASPNDPVEVIQMNGSPCVPGNIQVVRILGAFKTFPPGDSTSWKATWRFLAVRANAPEHLEASKWTDMDKVPEAELNELREWYKDVNKEETTTLHKKGVQYSIQEGFKTIARSVAIRQIYRSHKSWQWLQNASAHEKAKMPAEMTVAKKEMKDFTDRMETLVLDSQAYKEYKEGTIPKYDDTFEKVRLEHTCQGLSFAFKGAYQAGTDGVAKKFDCKDSMTVATFRGFYCETPEACSEQAKEEGLRGSQFLAHVYAQAVKEGTEVSDILGQKDTALMNVEDLDDKVRGACDFGCVGGENNEPIVGEAGGKVNAKGEPTDENANAGSGSASGGSGSAAGGGGSGGSEKSPEKSSGRSASVHLAVVAMMFVLSVRCKD